MLYNRMPREMALRVLKTARNDCRLSVTCLSSKSRRSESENLASSRKRLPLAIKKTCTLHFLRLTAKLRPRLLQRKITKITLVTIKEWPCTRICVTKYSRMIANSRAKCNKGSMMK